MKNWYKDINLNASSLTDKQLKPAIRNMSKIANTRLARLRDKGLAKASPAYRYAFKKAYDREDFMGSLPKILPTTIDEDGVEEFDYNRIKVKFNTDLRKLNHNQLVEEFSKLRTFLYEAHTSTISGTREKYIRSYDTFVKRHGYIPENVYAQMWYMDNIKTIMRMFGSDVEIITQIVDDKRFTTEEIDKMLSSIDEESKDGLGNLSERELMKRLREKQSIVRGSSLASHSIISSIGGVL